MLCNWQEVYHEHYSLFSLCFSSCAGLIPSPLVWRSTPASLRGLSLASSVSPVLTTVRPEDTRREKMQMCYSLMWMWKDETWICSKDVVFTHLLVLGPSVTLLFVVKIITGCPLAVGVFWIFVCSVSDLLAELWCLIENVFAEGFVFKGRFVDFKPCASGLTDLLLRNSRCRFSFSSFFISLVSNCLVGLRHEVTLLRPRRCSRFSALSSTIWSKPLSGESCVPLTARVSMAVRRLNHATQNQAN